MKINESSMYLVNIHYVNGTKDKVKLYGKQLVELEYPGNILFIRFISDVHTGFMLRMEHVVKITWDVISDRNEFKHLPEYKLSITNVKDYDYDP